jgi:uroporphyrinogen-III synthase
MHNGMTLSAPTKPIDLKNHVIAITRPIDQAMRLSAMIDDAGGKTLSFPLIEIAPLDDYTKFESQIVDLEKADWAIFISTNAVENAMPRVLKSLNDKKLNGFSQTYGLTLKFAAIGPVTAEAIKVHGESLGIEEVLVPRMRFDSEALLATPEMQAVHDQRIIIFRGIGGREVLADTLKKRGANVTFAESYQRINPQKDCAVLAQAVQNKSCDAIVVTSSEAMRHLLALANGADWLRKTPICVNHPRIKEETSAYGLNLGLTISIADAPGDEAMLACLNRTLNANV